MSERSRTSVSVATAALMIATASLAHYARPTFYLADTRPVKKIADVMPMSFGKWRAVPTSAAVVNPQQQELINILYSETISKTYISDAGYLIMLSIAYGRNQNDTFLLHTPDICYPSQGFSITSNEKGNLSTEFGVIPVKRLVTKMGAIRPEPVTYWTTLGDYFVRSGTDKKLREIKYAAKGQIADGLLFRISSIDPDESRAFSVHEEFADSFLKAVPSDLRVRLAGLEALEKK